MKKLFYIVMIFPFLLMTGCGSSEQSQTLKESSAGNVDESGHVTIEFWYSLGGNSGEVVEDLVTKFNQSQNEVTVNPTYQGNYAATMAKLWSSMSAGDVPMVAHVGGAPLLGDTGAILPITDFLDGSDGIDRQQVIEAFWDYNSAGGKVWSMPFNQSLPVLYYNQDLFTKAGLDPQQPPQTWEELIPIAQKLTLDTDGNGEIDQWGINTHSDTHWYLSTMFLSNGAEIINTDETEVLYTSPEAIEMLTLWGDLVNKYKVMPPNQHDEAKGDFLAGKLGMLISSSSNIPSMKTDAGFKVGVAMMPRVGDKDLKVPLGGAGLMIFKVDNEKLVSAAWKFVKFMTSKESMVYLSTQTGYLPIYSGALEWEEMTGFLAENPDQKVAIEQLQYAVSIPVFSALGTSDTELRKAIEEVELGANTPIDALEKAKAMVDQSIVQGSQDQ